MAAPLQHGSERRALTPSEEGMGVATREALDVAAYVSDMTAQLEAMALAGGLDLLAYFLGMARSEADLFVRTNTVSEAGDVAPDDSLSDEDQSEFGSDS
jgi:hypothetical protein